MLDAKYLREEFDEIKKNLKMRKDDDVISRLDSWKKKDDEWRALKLELDALKKQRRIEGEPVIHTLELLSP